MDPFKFSCWQYHITLPCSITQLQERLSDIASINPDAHIIMSVEVEEDAVLTYTVYTPMTKKQQQDYLQQQKINHRNKIIYHQQALDRLSSMRVE